MATPFSLGFFTRTLKVSIAVGVEMQETKEVWGVFFKPISAKVGAHV